MNLLPLLLSKTVHYWKKTQFYNSIFILNICIIWEFCLPFGELSDLFISSSSPGNTAASGAYYVYSHLLLTPIPKLFFPVPAPTGLLLEACHILLELILFVLSCNLNAHIRTRSDALFRFLCSIVCSYGKLFTGLFCSYVL